MITLTVTVSEPKDDDIIINVWKHPNPLAKYVAPWARTPVYGNELGQQLLKISYNPSKEGPKKKIELQDGVYQYFIIGLLYVPTRHKLLYKDTVENLKLEVSFRDRIGK